MKCDIMKKKYWGFKFMLDNLYENIGGKIKNWAKWTFIVEAVAAVIAGIAVIIDSEDFLLAFALILLGPIVAFIGSWILYAFGELVEKTSDTNNVIRKIESYTRNLKITYQDEQATEESTKREPELKAQQEAVARAKSEVEEKAKCEVEERAKQEAEEPNNSNNNSSVPIVEENEEKLINQIKDNNFIYVQCKNCRKEFSFQKGMKKVRCPWCNAKQD